MPWQTGTGTDDHVPPYPAQTVIPYHDIAGVTPDNTVILHLGPGTEKRAYRLIDGYCDNPDCAGSEMQLTLAARDEGGLTVSFRMEFRDGRLSVEKGKSPEDQALIAEFSSRREYLNLVLRRRQLVRAHGLAGHARRGPRRRFQGSCYNFSDFDKHREQYIIRFERAAEQWAVEDQYCAAPGCDCETAILTFFHYRPLVRKQTPDFSLRLDLATGRASGQGGEPLPDDQRQVFEHFLAVSPGWAYELSLRRRFLRQTAARLVKFPSASPEDGPAGLERRAPAVGALPREETLGETSRASFGEEAGDEVDESLGESEISRRTDWTGRNDPCPCGSGKKYKKCCLGKR